MQEVDDDSAAAGRKACVPGFAECSSLDCRSSIRSVTFLEVRQQCVHVDLVGYRKGLLRYRFELRGIE